MTTEESTIRWATRTTLVLHPIDNPTDPKEANRPALMLCHSPPLDPLPVPILSSNPRTHSSPESIASSGSSFVPDPSMIVLGRNVQTKIFDRRVSRKVAILKFIQIPQPPLSSSTSSSSQNVNYENGLLQLVLQTVDPPTSNQGPCVNGSVVTDTKTILKDGDEVGIHANRFRYRVHLISEERSHDNRILMPSDDVSHTASVHVHDSTAAIPTSSHAAVATTTAATTAAATKAAAAATIVTTISTSQNSNKRKCKEEDQNDQQIKARTEIQTTARDHIVDEVTCTICMEIIVQAHAINPCGHVFCKQCIEEVPPTIKANTATKSCPTCRKTVDGVAWLKSYDNVIWNLVLRGGVFGSGPHGEEDLRQFFIRSGRDLGELTEEQQDSIFGRYKVRNELGTVVDGNEDDDDEIQMVTVARARTTVGPQVVDEFAMERRKRRMERKRQRRKQSSGGTEDNPICL